MHGSTRRRVAGVLGGALLILAVLPASAAAAGPADHLTYLAGPTNTAAGGTISPVRVEVDDSTGTVVTTSTTVTVAIGANPGSPSGTLSGTTTEPTTNGVATFSDLSINQAGIGYTLVASTPEISGEHYTSGSFTIIGSPSKLAFGVQPSSTASGLTISPAVTVMVEDANGSLVTSSNALVGISILANPGSGVLGGTLAVNAINGVATFSNLSINNPGSGYTLQARSANVASATSNPFAITSTNNLVFVAQPGGGAAGAVWSHQPVVAVVNSLNQVVTTDTSTVYLNIATNPAGGTLSCTGGMSEAVVNGYAYFSGCSINVASSSYYTLSASSSASWTPATSSPFYIGGAQQLIFATQPGGGAAGAIWTQQPVVEVVNSANQIVTTDNSTIVYLSISTNPAGGTLSCTSGTYRTVVNGVASFYGCSINASSSNYYTLGATSSPSWTAATSGAFYVTGTRPALAITPVSALGLKPASGYTSSTPKYATVGKYVTWKFMGGAPLAGQRVNVMVATKVNGVWGLPKYLKSAWADANGIVTFAWTSKTAAAVNVRVQWPGNTTYGISTSKALGAYWK